MFGIEEKLPASKALNNAVMHTTSYTEIASSLKLIYSMTSDLERWPALLPHYRWVRWIEGGPDQGIVEMAAMRGNLPISWTSEYTRNPELPSLHFRHLSTFTKGMEVRWVYETCERGVRVTIEHDLDFRWPLLAPLAEPIISGFMIEWVAPRTLSTFKRLLERPS
jgi:ribosome-associated toxin RatA of RatAB toxin-antitoxin module